MVPVFRVHFWDRDKRTWKTFEVECPRLSSISEYAECITEKLADNYYNAVYRNCMRTVGDPDACKSVARQMMSHYYNALRPVIEAFLELEPVRTKTKSIMETLIRVNDDVMAAFNRRMIAVIRAIKMRGEGKPVRLGMSSKSLVCFDSDSRKYEALREMLVLALWLCKNYGSPSIIYPTMRGFHLISLEPMNKNVWEKVFNTVAAMANEGRLKHIDMLHVALSLSRGYCTVSVTGIRDIHYLIDSVKEPGTGKVLGCRLWYSPVALYRDRVAAELWEVVDAILPLERNEFYRRLRERWLQLLMELEKALRIRQ